MKISLLVIGLGVTCAALAPAGITRKVHYALGEGGSMSASLLPQDSGGGASHFTVLAAATQAEVVSSGVKAPGSTAFLKVTAGGWSAPNLWNDLPVDNFAFGIFANAAEIPSSPRDLLTLGNTDGALKLSLDTRGWSASIQNVNWIGPAGGVTNSFVSSQWAHLAVIRRNGVSTFYLNGLPQGSWGGVPVHGTGLLCQAPGGNSFFQGSIDQARVVTFDGESDDAEVLAALWGAPTLPAQYKQMFTTVAGRRYIATFTLSPAAGVSQISQTAIEISGSGLLVKQTLPTALPVGSTRAPFRIAFSADSTQSTVGFTFNSQTSPEIIDLQLVEAIEPIPSTSPRASQQAQIDRRYGMFIHYGMSTFANQEWTVGLPVSYYAPTNLNVDQWVKGARDAGMRHIILTAKHHEGFCLWDSPWTNYDVGSAAVKTDVVAAAAAACAKYGIRLGIYYSLWDRNFTGYNDDAAYSQYMLRQLAELLGNYGPICELWLDGGGNKSEHRWPNSELYDLMRRLQPECLVSTNWGSYHPGQMSYFPSDFRTADPYMPRFPDSKIYSHAGGNYYMPYESTVTLSAADFWFYNTNDPGPKPLNKLADFYYTATAQNNILILNASPDRRGLIRDVDLDQLYRLRDLLGIRIGMPLPKQVTGTHIGTASSTWNNEISNYGPQRALDGNSATRWASGPSGATTASFEINFGGNREFDRVLIDEYDDYGGTRIRRFELQAWNGSAWATFHYGALAGRHRLIDVPLQMTSKLRLQIAESTDAVTLNEFQAYDSKHAFGTWRDQNFSNANTQPAAEMEADPDRDQLPNRLEFILGSNPNVRNNLPAPRKVSDKLELVLPWNPNASSAFGSVSYSVDLVNWFDATSPVHPGVGAMNSATGNRSWQIDPQQHPKWFYKFK